MEEKEKDDRQEVESLCPECGHAFKTYMDRVLGDHEQESELAETVTCPVCGCGECNIVHPGSS